MSTLTTTAIRTFSCLAIRGDKEDLHFCETRNVDEKNWTEDAKELADWLYKNLSAGAYRALVIQIQKRGVAIFNAHLSGSTKENKSTRL